MNECDEVLPPTASRKKKRGSGFRFSSKKVLNRSRLKRLANARGCDVTSVTRTLSYPCLLPSEDCSSDIHERAETPSNLPQLVAIVESEEGGKENTNVDQFIDCEHPNSISIFFCSVSIFFLFTL